MPKRSEVRLNKRVLDELPILEKLYSVFDSDIPGFGVQVHPTGALTFVLKYRFEGRQHWIKLGRFRVDLTVDQARKLALSKRGEVAEGSNPHATRKDAKAALTIREVGEKFLVEHVKAKLKPKTQEVYGWNLKKHIYPRLGARTIRSLDVSDARALHHSLRDRPRTANMVLNILSKIFNLSEQWGYRPLNSNPCHLVERFHEGKRTCRLEDDQIRSLGEALESLEQSDAIPVIMVRLLLATGARRGEVLGLRWDELDLTKGRECIRKSEHKTSRISGEKVIPLTKEALGILKKLPKRAHPLVFPFNTVSAAETALKRFWSRLRRRADLPELRIHDLRHVFASVAIDAGVSEEVIGAILGQKTREVVARYAHLGRGPARSGAERTIKALSAKLQGKPTTLSRKQ